MANEIAVLFGCGDLVTQDGDEDDAGQHQNQRQDQRADVGPATPVVIEEYHFVHRIFVRFSPILVDTNYV